LGDEWKLFLYPLTARYKELVKDYINLNEIGYPSRAMGVRTEQQVSSISRSRQRHPFEFVLGFRAPVWIALLITMLIIPLSFCMIEKSFSGYFRNMWNYSYLILSENMPKMPKCSMKRFVLTFWLLACTVLLSGYSGVLRDLFIRANPDDVIDSWKDLYDRKDIKIFAIEGPEIYRFVEIEKDTNEMARDFASRLEKAMFVDEVDWTKICLEKLFSGYAVSCLDTNVEDCHFFAMLYFKDKIHLCKKVHTAKYISTTSSYSIFISRLIINKDVKVLNNM